MAAGVRSLGLAVGIVIALASIASLFTTLVVPRVSSARLLRYISAGFGTVAARAARVLRSYEARDRLLSVVGPLGIVGVFVVWVGLLIGSIGLIRWGDGGSTLEHSMALAGSSAATLGIVGGIVALEIAYLPTLYSTFSAREAEVSLLATRAGVPAWGPELLARAQRFGLMGDLPDLYRTWERWAAAVAESHTNYPTLMWLRSPEPWQNWLIALVATMDAAALQHALSPASAPVQARLCLQVGTNCLRSLAGALRVPYDRDPLPTAPVRLTYEEYLVGIDRLARAGFSFERSPDEAWRHFRGWRVNYESIADALTEVFMPPPAPWFVDRPWLGAMRYPFVLNRTPDDPQASVPKT